MGTLFSPGKLLLTSEYVVLDGALALAIPTKYGQDFLDNEAFTYLPDIRKLGMEDIDEKKFYKLIY